MDVSENAKAFRTQCSICRGEPFSEPERNSQWPRWALLIKRLRTDADKGVGDTAQRIAAKFGGERYMRLTKRLGMPCGCSERQDEWNRLYPYGD